MNELSLLNLELSDEEIAQFVSGEREGIKMIKLKLFHDMIIEKSLSEIPFQKFFECYSDLNKHLDTKSFLSYIYSNVFPTLSERIKSDFQLICKERQISIKLSELEQLHREQPLLQNGKRAPPFCVVNPEEQIKTQISELKLQEKGRLLSIYQNLLNENNKSKKQVEDLEKQKNLLIQKINSKIDNVSKLVELSVSLDT
ncbi:hypothetical protein DICPUDRAFT_83487 [Dictyostelium purpureum]|uniref:Uncharacterized protein n=1 Tax=Dictyostelium purpureum TaxID=5786 RepID=F0ZZP5_DICPU|nr:uncharacterized protein DICPUDRAFT_83487 [Dictyostelium purpureum]EGC30583.1 hypothetical protein DICPUDRAFT_83487 [Dictyostelium purpureum]|eukprot:XP_003292891.1 hypothetical protein DICPUDRAFT_83487 [Dictyostelium purpureum]